MLAPKQVLPTSIIKGTLFVFGGQALSAALRLLTLSMLTSVLDVKSLGTLAMSLAAAEIIAVLGDLGLNAVLLRQLPEQCPRTQLAFMRKMLATKLSLLATVAVVVLLAIVIPSPQLFPEPLNTVQLLLGLGGGIGLSLHGFVVSVFQARFDYLYSTLLQVSINLIRLILTCGLVFAGLSDPRFLLASFLLAPLIGVVTAFYLVLRPSMPTTTPLRTNSKVQMSIVRLGLGVAIVQATSIFITRGDVLALGILGSQDETATYLLGSQVAYVLALVGQAMLLAALPRMSDHAERTLIDTYSAVTLRQACLGLISLLGISLLGGCTAEILYGHVSESVAVVTTLLCLGNGVGMVFSPVYAIFYKETRIYKLLLINFLQFGILAALSITLVPSEGAIGTAIAAVAVRVFGSASALMIARSLIPE